MLIKMQMAKHAINLSEYVLQKVFKFWESFISYMSENNTRSTTARVSSRVIESSFPRTELNEWVLEKHKKYIMVKYLFYFLFQFNKISLLYIITLS